MTDTRSQKTKSREKTKETQTNIQRPQQTPSSRSKTEENTSNPTTQNQGQPNANQQLDLQKRNYTAKEVKVGNSDWVAKPPPDQPTAAAKHPPTTTTTAKQPSEQHSDKASTNQHDLDDVEESKRGQAQKWILPELSNRPSPARATKTMPPGRERRRKRRRRPTNMV